MDQLGPDFRLDGKVAIVTGASRGIGEAIAVAFAACGARVALASRKLGPPPKDGGAVGPQCGGLEKVAERIAQAGGTALAVACHTGRPDEVKALVDATVAAFGRVDVLVNNAATNPYFGPLVDLPDGALDKTIEVNLKGYFHAAREVIRHLSARGAPGAIVNVASVAGLRGAPMQGAYGMTKAAVIAMTQTLAVEVGPRGIRVNAIAPGLVETRLAQSIVDNEALRRMFVDRTPLGRHAQPREIVGAALLLASDAGSFLNGHTLVVDGGYTIS
jgi:NAD(P)-dependent dehydrogenase (short-subunit alcohol dehydrogenase family)